jgi:mannosyltransferase OCH1-like enzyme
VTQAGWLLPLACRWTNEDNRRLVAQHFTWFLATYDSLPQDIMRADAARYMWV